MTDFVNDLKCLNCKHCFRRSEVFTHLKDHELDELNEGRLEVNFKKGEIIYKQGTPLTHIVVIHSGLGKIYVEGDSGKNLILSYTKEYDLNGDVGVFVDSRHHTSLMAVTDCGACFVDIRSFKKILKENPVFMEAYIREQSMKTLFTYQQFAVLTQKNMEGRMAESILYLQNRVFQNGSIHHISKQDLAELTAMTKESALRVLKEFKDDGIIEIDKNSIHILDNNSLEKIAKHG